MTLTKQLSDCGLESVLKMDMTGVEPSTGGGSDIMFRAAGIGNLDRHMDVFCPGAFAPEMLATFLKEGTILFNHDYEEEPIAMPISAQEVGSYLMIGADWHSTSFAQDKKTIAEERMAKGLQVGSSIGFYPQYKWFENGQDLLAWAVGMGYDMALFDTATIRDHDDWCWAIPKVEQLVENSLLGVLPANPAAEVESLKRAFDTLATRSGDPDGSIERKFLRMKGATNKTDLTPQPEPVLVGVSLREVDSRIRLMQGKLKNGY